MANIMSKRGQQDNVVTYEHICDTPADLQNIDPHYVTLGSVAIVLKDEQNNPSLQVYMATSDKQWINISTISSGGNDSTSPVDNLSVANVDQVRDYLNII